MAIKRFTRIWTKSREDVLSLPTRDDPFSDDSRPIDSQGYLSSEFNSDTLTILVQLLKFDRRLECSQPNSVFDLQNKRRWFVRSKGQTHNRVFFGGYGTAEYSPAVLS